MLAAAAVALIVAGPAAADDTGWTVRARAAWVDPDFSFSEAQDNDVRINAFTDSELGLGIDVEYRTSRRIGFELGLVWAQPDLVIHAEAPDGESLEVKDGLRFMPISAGVSIHLTPDAPVDVYVTPFFAYVMYGDLSYDSPQMDPLNLSVDSDVAWGASLGADFAIGDRLTLNAMVRYYDTDLKATDDEGDTDRLSFDTWVYGLGVGYRF
jgi:outer membrane protein W